MQSKQVANQRYAQDKPADCAHCYFWNNFKRVCTEEKCYYLLSEKEAERGSCGSCPYGKHSPCIGYCLLKIMREIHQRKKAHEEGR